MKIGSMARAKPLIAHRYRAAVVLALLSTAAAGVSNAPAQAASTSGQRVYEMVSPLDKNGGDIDRDVPYQDYSTSGAAPSGDAVAYSSQGQFGNNSSGAPYAQYRSVRTGAGWVTRGIDPPLVPDPEQNLNTPRVPFLSVDLTRAVVQSNKELTASAAKLGGSGGLYLQDHTGSSPSYRLLSDPFAPLPPEAVNDPDQNFRFIFSAATDDMSHIVFVARGRQLAADAPVLEPSSTILYEWVNGILRPVSVLPDGVVADQADPGARSTGQGSFFPGDHLISQDGSRVFFTAYKSDQGITGGLYVRKDGSVTEPVSASERAADDPPGDDPPPVQPATFEAAESVHGSSAVFTSPYPLTDDATATFGGSDLYLWREDPVEGKHLEDLTVADPAGGGVLAIAAAADDLSHVYFVATGDLADGAEAGQPNLYAWTPGDGVRHVATLTFADEPVWSVRRDDVPRFRDARVSAGGGQLVFASTAKLTDADNAGHKQVYRYDYASGGLTCLSCTTLAPSSGADAGLFPMTGTASIKTPAVPYRLTRNLSSDGRVIFESADRLVLADTNGKSDVYEWDAGSVRLISSGVGSEGSKFIDASADGRDVFFTTRERLVAADRDSQIDIYDARIGGGFPEQPPPPNCEDDACQQPKFYRPSPLLPGSSILTGRGDVTPGKRPTVALGKISSKQRGALSRGRTVALAVRVNRAGSVRLTGKARMAGRLRTVVSVSRSASKAGVVRLPVRLSGPARKRLSAGHSLSVSLSVGFGGVSDEKAVSLKRTTGRVR